MNLDAIKHIIGNTPREIIHVNLHSNTIEIGLDTTITLDKKRFKR